MEKEYSRDPVERIKEMESLFDRVKQKLDRAEADPPEMDPLLPEEIKKLEDYYTSPLWMQDFEADERGLLPSDLKRGVLSGDGIDDLLERYNSMKQPYAATDPHALRTEA
jgi:hypothetical protein